MSPLRRRGRISGNRLGRIGIGFLLAGFFLFLQVWWPIQAERAAGRLAAVEREIDQTKHEISALQTRSAALTSLTALDRWAQKNGPWRASRPQDVFPIEN